MKNKTFPLLLLIATIVNLGISQSANAQSIPGEGVDFSRGNSELGSKVSGELSVSFDKDKKLTDMGDQVVFPVAKNLSPLSKQKQIMESIRPKSSTKTAFYVNSGFTSVDTSLDDLLESRTTRVSAKKNNQNLLRKAINQSQSVARINQNTRKASFSKGDRDNQSFLAPPRPFFKRKDAIASTPPPDDFPQTKDLSDRKKGLKIDPLVFNNTARIYSPSLTFTFSAFGANWGDLFIAGSGASPGRQRGGRIDGYLGFGFGLGDAYHLVGSTVSYNMQSIRHFGGTNGVDVDLHRIVFSDAQTQVAMAVGVTNLIKVYYLSDRLATGYWGAITSYIFLRPDDPVNTLPLALTVGGASGQYNSQADVGIFGGVGIQLAPQLGVGAAWSGVSLDLGISYVPISTFPLTLTMEGIDLTNNTPGGPRFLLGINLGYNFSPRGY